MGYFDQKKRMGEDDYGPGLQPTKDERGNQSELGGGQGSPMTDQYFGNDIKSSGLDSISSGTPGVMGAAVPGAAGAANGYLTGSAIAAAAPSAAAPVVTGTQTGSVAGPVGAGIGAAAGLLSAYMQADAAMKNEKRKAQIEAAQNQGNMEQGAFSNLMGAWRGALR